MNRPLERTKVVRRRAKRLVTGPDDYGSTYVYFAPQGRKSARTFKHHGMVNLDFDKNGRLIGIELLAVPWQLP
jgi:hypothetical protein